MRHFQKTKILLLCLIASFYACNPDVETLPEGILSESEMVLVITDLQLLEAAQKNVRVSGKKMNLMRDTSSIIVFNKHSTDYAQFDSSLRSYSNFPKKLEIIMDKVALNLNKTK